LSFNAGRCTNSDLPREVGQRIDYRLAASVTDTVHWFLLAWSRQRKCFVPISAVLVLVAFGTMQFWPISPTRAVYDHIRVGMNVEQVAEVLEQCGWSQYRSPRLPWDWPLLIVAGRGIETELLIGPRNYGGTLHYEGPGGETLSIRWDEPWEYDQLRNTYVFPGHVVGKEYHSGIELKLRALWDRLWRMAFGRPHQALP
jgi:hypothetical protein